MTIRVDCSGCGTAYKVGDDKAGRRFRCKQCDTLVDVPVIDEDFELVTEEPAGAYPRRNAGAGKSSKSGKSSNPPSSFGFAQLVRTIRRFNDFSGRSNRTEYWNLYLLNTLVYMTLFVMLRIFDSGIKNQLDTIQIFLFVMWAFYALVVFLPSLALLVRRLHDTNRSAWCLLIFLLPGLGMLLALFIGFYPGTPGRNDYGAAPK